MPERMREKMYTCPNPSCRKVFTAPLKTLNFRQEPSEPYDACPYCLTKIIEAKKELPNKPERAQTETSLTKGKTTKNLEPPSACQYHLGYLSERAQNQQVSEVCIVCKDIVEWMLQKMRS